MEPPKDLPPEVTGEAKSRDIVAELAQGTTSSETQNLPEILQSYEGDKDRLLSDRLYELANISSEKDLGYAYYQMPGNAIVRLGDDEDEFTQGSFFYRGKALEGMPPQDSMSYNLQLTDRKNRFAGVLKYGGHNLNLDLHKNPDPAIFTMVQDGVMFEWDGKSESAKRVEASTIIDKPVDELTDEEFALCINMTEGMKKKFMEMHDKNINQSKK